MSGLIRGKGMYLLVGIIVTCVVLINVDFARAQTTKAITLLQGQSATISVSPATGFGLNTIFVTSIGNATLQGRINPPGFSPNTAAGFWLISAIGTGGRTFFDISGGVLPWAGQSAAIDIGPGLSFGVITSTFFATTPDPVSYNVAVGQ